MPESTNHGESSWTQFVQLQADLSLSDEQFAAAIFSLPLIREKTQLVAQVMAGKWPSPEIDDALQEATISVYLYLRATRGWSFTGTTDNALGGWIFGLLRQNARWAISKIRRGEQRRKKREDRAAQGEAHAGSPLSIERLYAEAFTFFDQLPPRLRTVALDYHAGVPVEVTAQTCGISRRTVYECRVQVLAQVTSLLADIL